MSSYFLKSGNTFKIAAKEAIDIREELPPGNFIICEDPFGNLYLEKIDEFSFSGKQYGSHTQNTTRILNTFLSRSSTTGVMLAGEKGSGKSLLAKSVSIEAAKLNIPTLVINSAMHGDKFNSFLQSITQPCIILFDEFEKVYDTEAQESILTLLDGVFPSKKLFLLTCNDKWRVDIHMRNRPGRIFYFIEFNSVDPEFIKEYCEDNLNDKEKISEVCRVATFFSKFNFDMLKAIVEEMNRYNESPVEVLKFLNAKPEYSEDAVFSTTLVVGGRTIPSVRKFCGNPSKFSTSFDYRLENDEWSESAFSSANLKSVKNNGKEFLFINDAGDSLLLTRKEESTFNMFAI